MPNRLLPRLAPLRPPWRDVLVALAFTLAMVGFGVAAARHGPGDTEPLRLYLPSPKGVRIVKEIGGGPGGVDWGNLAGTVVLITLPLAWRRRLPLVVFAAQIAGALVVHDVNIPGFLAIMVGAYTLARYGRRPELSLGALLAAAAVVAASFPNTVPQMPAWSAPFLILLPIWLSGTAIRTARARADAAAQRATLLEREREAATRIAVIEERARIARELHDMVSHHVSVMTIQAGAAGKVLDARPDLARAAVGAIEASGREAMGELRNLLGLLTVEAGEPGDHDALRPQPGLDQLDALIAKVRAAGQPVTVHAATTALPRGVDVTAYRVVQEALTNALRYAPGAGTDVVVDRDGDALSIEVTNDEADQPATVLGTGSGLLGLAERVRLYDGTLTAGPRPGGGFRVRARIPLESA